MRAKNILAWLVVLASIVERSVGVVTNPKYIETALAELLPMLTVNLNELETNGDKTPQEHADSWVRYLRVHNQVDMKKAKSWFQPGLTLVIIPRFPKLTNDKKIKDDIAITYKDDILAAVTGKGKIIGIGIGYMNELLPKSKNHQSIAVTNANPLTKITLHSHLILVFSHALETDETALDVLREKIPVTDDGRIVKQDDPELQGMADAWATKYGNSESEQPNYVSPGKDIRISNIAAIELNAEHLKHLIRTEMNMVRKVNCVSSVSFGWIQKRRYSYNSRNGLVMTKHSWHFTIAKRMTQDQVLVDFLVPMFGIDKLRLKPSKQAKELAQFASTNSMKDESFKGPKLFIILTLDAPVGEVSIAELVTKNEAYIKEKVPSYSKKIFGLGCDWKLEQDQNSSIISSRLFIAFILDGYCPPEGLSSQQPDHPIPVNHFQLKPLSELPPNPKLPTTSSQPIIAPLAARDSAENLPLTPKVRNKNSAETRNSNIQNTASGGEKEEKMPQIPIPQTPENPPPVNESIIMSPTGEVEKTAIKIIYEYFGTSTTATIDPTAARLARDEALGLVSLETLMQLQTPAHTDTQTPAETPIPAKEMTLSGEPTHSETMTPNGTVAPTSTEISSGTMDLEKPTIKNLDHLWIITFPVREIGNSTLDNLVQELEYYNDGLRFQFQDNTENIRGAGFYRKRELGKNCQLYSCLLVVVIKDNDAASKMVPYTPANRNAGYAFPAPRWIASMNLENQYTAVDMTETGEKASPIIRTISKYFGSGSEENTSYEANEMARIVSENRAEFTQISSTPGINVPMVVEALLTRIIIFPVQFDNREYSTSEIIDKYFPALVRKELAGFNGKLCGVGLNRTVKMRRNGKLIKTRLIVALIFESEQMWSMFKRDDVTLNPEATALISHYRKLKCWPDISGAFSETQPKLSTAAKFTKLQFSMDEKKKSSSSLLEGIARSLNGVTSYGIYIEKSPQADRGWIYIISCQ